MKTTILISSLIFLAGCHNVNPPPKTDVPQTTITPTPSVPLKEPLATADDCNRIYVHVLTIRISEMVDENDPPSQQSIIQATKVLDANYKATGIVDKFYAHCTNHYTQDEITCMLGANSLEAMDLCEQFFPGK